MPVVGRKSSDYGHRLNPYSRQWRFHAGVDIAAPGGTPIRAAADGTVTEVNSYDGSGRPTDVRTTVGSGGSAVTESFATTYDGSGRASQVVQQRSVGGGSFSTVR